MKTLNLYLSSTNKKVEDIIIEQFKMVEKKENILVSVVKDEPLIKYCDVFVLYLGFSVKECFKAAILKESKINMKLKTAINCNKKILLAYSPEWNQGEDKYVFYETKIQEESTEVIKIEGIAKTAIYTSELLNIYCKNSIMLKNKSNQFNEMPLYSEKCTEHQFEANLLLNTKIIFNEELLLIN